MPRSATKRAHSSWPIDEKVHDATIVSCFLNMSGLTSIVTLLRSPTKQGVPHTFVARPGALRSSGGDEVWSVYPAPCFQGGQRRPGDFGRERRECGWST